MATVDDQEKKRYYTEQLIDLIAMTRSNLDNALLRICSLGIPLTIAFKGDVFGNCDQYQWMFIGFIVSWAVTVILVIISFEFSEKGFKKTKQNVAKLKFEDHVLLKRTTIVNWCSLAGFVIGILFIATYAILNAYF